MKFVSAWLALLLLASCEAPTPASHALPSPGVEALPSPTVSAVVQSPSPAVPSALPSHPVSPSPASSPLASASPAVTAPVSSSANRSEILKVVAASSCAAYSWKHNGKEPLGFAEGLALAYSRSLCKYRGAQHTNAGVIGQPVTTSSLDSLYWYKQTIASTGSVASSGEDRIRQVYTLLFGLAARESSGNYCTGYDTTAKSHEADTSESGPFQTSYNSINAKGASAELKALYAEYQANPSLCELDTWKKGASCPAQSIIGTGAGADYQRFSKACPGFDAEYAATLARVLRTHWGPLDRYEAEYHKDCETLLKNVADLVSCS